MKLFGLLPLLALPAASPPETQVIPCEAPPAEMACIPGGVFQRGSDKGPRNAQPQEEIFLQTFYMDVYELTVEKYDACVQAGRCRPAKTNYSDFSRPKQPKVGVDWYHARDYCTANGRHLPTEAEWEKAARGGDGRLYPWGEQKATCELSIIMDRRGRSCGVRKLGGEADKGRTFEVGSRPPNQFGLYDMSGNSWEWVYDWYSPSYKACGDACRGSDPKGPCGGQELCKGHGERLVRGGSWFWPASHATTIYRRPHTPHNRPYHHFGFRCAASIEEARNLRAVTAP